MVLTCVSKGLDTHSVSITIKLDFKEKDCYFMITTQTSLCKECTGYSNRIYNTKTSKFDASYQYYLTYDPKISSQSTQSTG